MCPTMCCHTKSPPPSNRCPWQKTYRTSAPGEQTLVRTKFLRQTQGKLSGWYFHNFNATSPKCNFQFCAIGLRGKLCCGSSAITSSPANSGLRPFPACSSRGMEYASNSTGTCRDSLPSSAFLYLFGSLPGEEPCPPRSARLFLRIHTQKNNSPPIHDSPTGTPTPSPIFKAPDPSPRDEAAVDCTPVLAVAIAAVTWARFSQAYPTARVPVAELDAARSEYEVHTWSEEQQKTALELTPHWNAPSPQPPLLTVEAAVTDTHKFPLAQLAPY